MRECNKNIECLMELSRKLLFCADRGDIQREDDSCGVLFGMTRDCAYKIMESARKERDAHIAKGIWDSDEKTQI
jgi:hypothetical protein